MSLRRSIDMPRACSGDMYPTLPLSAPVRVRTLDDAALATPKSASLIAPS
jgi:hypothetical protein